MQRKNPAILGAIVASLFLGLVNAGADESAIRQPSNHQAQQLAAIEADISGRRKMIEDRYAARIKELRERAAKQIEQFEETERTNLANTAVKTGWFFENVGLVPRGYTQDANALWLSDERAAETEKRIAEHEKKVLSDLEQAVGRLERERRYVSGVGLVDLEKRLKDNVVKPMPAPTRGLLTGIVYGEEKQAALLDRNIVHEGDVVYGVRIIGIHRHKVEFEKSGQRWEQKVGGTPEGFWQ